MLIEEIGTWFRRFFSRGARPDTEKELMEDGLYEYAVNMRPGGVDGTAGSLSKIGGEEPIFRVDPSIGLQAGSYLCIGACKVDGRRVSFWASVNPDSDPVLIVIDGIVMVRSMLIPYRFDRTLQMGDVDKIRGAIIFPVDGHADPLMWRIKEIVAAYEAGSDQYFAGFNLDMVTVALAAPVEWCEHVGNPEIGQGLAPGQYVYRLRYRSPSGDVTNYGPPTAHITVNRVEAPVYAPIDLADKYPGAQTVGGAANPNELVPTRYGIELRYQVDNTNDFQEVEIVRTRFNTGGGLSDPGVDEVIARIPIGPGQFDNNLRFVDPRDQNYFEEIPVLEAQSQQASITAPQSVEHVDNSVIYGGFVLNSRVADLEFRSVDGVKVFPITERVWTRYNGQFYNDGYADPVNNTYLKSARRNEKYDIGLMLWDGSSGKAPVVAVQRNMQMPDRRDRKTGDSLFNSSNPCYAANNENQGADPVSPTFEAIVQGEQGKETTGPVAFVNVMGPALGGFSPWLPKGPEDADASRFRFSPVNGAFLGNPNPEPPYGASPSPISGRVFANEYHALGVGIYGPTNIPQAAPWAKVISVMRSAPAGRVITQGFGAYSLTVGSINPGQFFGGKERNQLRCSFPEIDAGVVPEAILDDMTLNPGSYKLLLTPYGFYTEPYGYYSSQNFFTFGSWAVDMISYAWVQHDQGQVNVGESAGTMGYQPSSPIPNGLTNFVGPGAWRSTPPSGSPASAAYSIFSDPANQQQGKFLFTMSQFTPYAEGRGRNFLIRTEENIYRADGTTANGTAFLDPQTRRFHEPMYLVTIIKDGVEVPELNVPQYISTGHHIAIERCIGIAPEVPAGSTFEVELFHARIGDAISDWTTGEYRYCYVRTQGLPERRFVCANNNDVQAQFSAIISSIQADGFWVAPDGERVYGLYEGFIDVSGVRNRGFLRFPQYSGIPIVQPGSRIIVKYNKDEVIRAFGFDATIGPSIYAVYDRYFNGTNGLIGPGQNCHVTSAPLPYSAYTKSPGYILPRTPTGTENVSIISYIRSIRQWCVMWEGELRLPVHQNIFAGDEALNDYAFPRKHYVTRPYQFVPGSSALAMGMPSQYDQAYPGEFQIFAYGGFHFKSGFNLDYARKPLVTGVGVPGNGNEIRTDYRTAYIRSLREDPLQQNSPGLRTFLLENIFPISEENGKIVSIKALDQGGFQQLWGWCERGLHRVPYNKNTLIGADGQVIGQQLIDNFWPREEIWVTRGQNGKGMPDMFYGLSTKANAPVGGGDIDTVFWWDKTSAYQLVGGQVIDLARQPGAAKFNSILQPVLNSLRAGRFAVYSCAYNAKHGEVWWSFLQPNGPGRPPTKRVLVYSAVNREWVGEFTYNYDIFVAEDNDMIGYRDLSANMLGKGLTMLDGDTPIPFECWAETPFAPFPFTKSELVAWRVAPDKPDQIEVYDKRHVLMVRTSEQLQEAFEAGTGQDWVLDIDSWQQAMNCVDESYDPDRTNPPQGEMFYFRVYHNTIAPFRLTFASLKARQLT